MSEIVVNHSGIQGQSVSITSSAQVAEQFATSYNSQSAFHQGGVDGSARFDTLQFSRLSRQAVDVACITTNNLNTFIKNASQEMSAVDNKQSGRFIVPS